MEPDRIGQNLGNYLLLAVLGTGGFATVYLGEHKYLKSQAAIKILKMLAQSDKARDKFLREARTIARLTHPHIIRVIECGVDVGVAGSTPYIVMSYAARGNVRNEYQAGEILPLDVVLSFTKQVADALQYAHDQDIVHCDVKPENMLIDVPGQILLGDFGIANVSHTANINAQQTSLYSDPTISGDIQGTVTYMAPERFQGLIRRASDQYSLAIVVYEWLTGRPPFTGSREQVMYQHMSMRPPELHRQNAEVSPEVEQVVLKALEKEPNNRYAAIKEFAEALERAILASPAYLALSAPPSPISPFRQAPIRIAPPTPAPGSQFSATQTQPVPAGADSASTEEDAQEVSALLGEESMDVIDSVMHFPSIVQPLPDDDDDDLDEDSEVLQVPMIARSALPDQIVGQISSLQAIDQVASLQQVAAQMSPLTVGPSPSQHIVQASPSQVSSAGLQSGGGSTLNNASILPLAYDSVNIPDPQQMQYDAAGMAGKNPLHTSSAYGGGLHHGQIRGGALPFDDDEDRGFFSNLGAVLGSIVALEGDFARVAQLRWFRRLGGLLNCLCTIAFGLVTHSLFAVLAGIVILGIFWLCIRLVKPFMATIISLPIAAYWGFFGFFLSKWLSTMSTFLAQSASMGVGIVFFVVSVILHIYYITHRLDA